ncbi:MAG: VOC family protein [Planctomycetota bacterium]
MQLGNFSVSLTVKDLEKSRAFYEKLGFSIVGGSPAQNYLVLQNGTTTIGLFHGMFDKNILTFNPGWTKDKEVLEDFDDVRELQARLRDAGVALVTETDPEGTGPASIYLVDPDGNPILIDQHVPRPEH